MQQLILKSNKKIQQQLNEIFDEITKQYFDEDQQIYEELDPLLEQLDQDDLKDTKIYMNKHFSDFSFIKSNNYVIIEDNNSDEDYQLIFKELKNSQQWEKLIFFLQNTQFCQQNSIPLVINKKENISFLSNYKQNLKTILDLIDLINQKQYQYKPLLTILLQNIYGSQNFSTEEQKVFQILIGTLLKPLLFQFEQYKQQLLVENQNKQIIQEIQKIQLSVSKEQNLIEDPSFTKQENQFILLTTQNMANNKKNLDIYFCKMLQTNTQILNYNTIQQCIDEVEYFQENIEECYFRVLLFFWIQQSSLVYKIEEQQQELKNTIEKTSIERRPNVLNRFLSKYKKCTNDEIYLFLLFNLVYFTQDNQEYLNQEECQQFLKFQEKQVPYIREFIQLSTQEFLQQKETDLNQIAMQIKFLPLNLLYKHLKHDYQKFQVIIFFHLFEIQEFTKIQQLLLLLLDQKIQTAEQESESQNEDIQKKIIEQLNPDPQLDEIKLKQQQQSDELENFNQSDSIEQSQQKHEKNDNSTEIKYPFSQQETSQLSESLPLNKKKNQLNFQILKYSNLLQDQKSLFKSNEINYLLNLKKKCSNEEEKESINLLIKMYNKYRKFDQADLMLQLQKVIIEATREEKLLQPDSLLLLISLKNTDWMMLYSIFEQELLVNFAISLYKNYTLKYFNSQIFETLKKLVNLIHFSQDNLIILLKLIFQKVDPKLFYWIILLNSKFVQNQTILPQKLFRITIIFIFSILAKQTKVNQLFILDNMNLLIQSKFYDFQMIKNQLKEETKTNLRSFYQICMIYYCHVTNSDQILKECTRFCFEDQELYEKWRKKQEQFQQFKYFPNHLVRMKLASLLPSQGKITLDDFNISLTYMSDNQQKEEINKWVKCSNSDIEFKNLIPFFFNIIKRGEHAKLFIKQINQQIKSILQENLLANLNMKAMFQIFFNNSNDELKVMLLKLRSKLYPVPLIYQNLNTSALDQEINLYQINSSLSYIFPDSYTIINLSLSKTQTQIGKTQLINKIFYQEDKFEISDTSEINKNTVDIMFDFIFGITRKLCISDVHGSIPLELLAQILPLFKLWIVQLDTEKELQENYEKVLELRKMSNKKSSKICFIIRNSKSNLIQQYNELFKQIEQDGFYHYELIDLKNSGLDNQVIEEQIDSSQRFIFQLIQNNLVNENQSEDLVSQSDFLEAIKSINEDSKKFTQDSLNEINLLKQLDEELEIQIQHPDGFFNENAFSLRSYELKLKTLKVQHSSLLSQKLNQDNEKQKSIRQIQQQISELEESIQNLKPTKLISLFNQIFQQKSYYILYLQFTEKIRKFNETNTYTLQDENQSLNEKLQKLIKDRNQKKNKQVIEKIDEELQPGQSNEIKQQIENLKENIKRNQQNISLKNIGIEIFWRELISIKQRCIGIDLNCNPIEIVYEMIKKGEPFEFLDGDQLKIDHQFLKELTNKFQSSANEKVLVFSVLGPQSSGKSTILNKIFGCHFWTSVGRCTKGIYLQLIKVQQKQQFDNSFDYLLILDSEGLQNPNQKDPEFDKKIALFILTISDIILINVKGDIHQQFRNLVEMCIFTLGQMKTCLQSVKQLSWCFNQNSDVENYAPFLEQIQEIASSLNIEYNQIDNDESKQVQNKTQNIDYNEILDINKENIQILGFAQTEKNWKINQDQGIYKIWRQQINNETFSEEVYQYGMRIINNFKNKYQKQNGESPMSSLNYFISTIDSNWQSISRLPDLLEFTELIQYKHDSQMKKALEIILIKEDFNAHSSIHKEITLMVKKEKKLDMQIFKQIQQTVQQKNSLTLSNKKEQLVENLLKAKQDKKISKKIYNKYLKQLQDKFTSYELECILVILDEIKQKETTYQKQKGFLLLDQEIYAITKNQNTQKEYLQNDDLIKSKFDQIWDKIKKQQIEQQKSVFSEFSENNYEAISQQFLNYQLTTENERLFQAQFIEKWNKSSPSEQQQEKEEIFQMFKVELKQNQLKILESKHGTLLLVDIFHQSLEEKLKFNKNQNFIDFNKYYQYQLRIDYITKEELDNYIFLIYDDNNESLFVNDLKYQIKQYREMVEKYQGYLKEQYWKQDEISTLEILKIQFNVLKNFFYILDSFGFSYQNQQLQSLLETIKSKTWYKILTRHSEEINDKIVGFMKTVKKKSHTPNFNSNFKPEEFKFFYQSLRVESVNKQFYTEEELNNYVQQFPYKYIFNKQQKLIPITNDDYLKYSLTYIATHESIYQNCFRENFIQQFSNLMDEQNSWQKIYFELYDLVKDQMIVKSIKKEKSDSVNESEDGIESSQSGLIRKIMSDIDMKIESYNKQLANYGIILNHIGERCMHYFSKFIIWRFSSYKKWKSLNSHIKQLEDSYPSQLQKFKEDIRANKNELSVSKAKTLAQNIFEALKVQIYKNKQPSVQNDVKKEKKTSQVIIEELDRNLLEQYTSENQQQSQIMEYIVDQKKYIQDYVKNKINQIKETISDKYKKQIQQDIKTDLGILKDNIQLIQKHTMLQNPAIKSSNYFEEEVNKIGQTENDNSTDLKKEDYFQEHLYNIIFEYIQGDSVQEKLQLIDKNYHCYFNNCNIKPKNMFIINNIQKSDEKIPLLKPFIETLYQEIVIYQNKSETLDLNAQDIKLDEYLKELELEMNGCSYSCRFCNRKCDNDGEGHRHQCSNGHQLRGMNGILINQNKPSLWSCDEMTNNQEVTIEEIKLKKKWSEVKARFPNWNFENENYQKLGKKMRNIWNNGIGQEVCNHLKQKLNKEIQFLIKDDYFQFQTCHYILMLDDSGSMQGQLFSQAKQAAINCLDQISHNPNSLVSVIIFNHQARIALDYVQISKINAKKEGEEKIVFVGGGTDFDEAFSTAYELINKRNKELTCDQTIFFFFTDGEAQFPEKAIKKFESLSQSFRQTIQLNACTIGEQQTIKEIVAQFKKLEIQARVQNINCVKEIEQKWLEIISKNVFDQEANRE